MIPEHLILSYFSADKTQYPSTRYLLTYLHAEHYSTTLAYAKGNAGHYAKRGFKPGRTQKQSPKTPRVDKVCVLKVQTEQGVGCRNGDEGQRETPDTRGPVQ